MVQTHNRVGAGLILPGGMVEEGESPADAGRREVAEELGLDVDIGNLLVVEHRAPRAHRPSSRCHRPSARRPAGVIRPSLSRRSAMRELRSDVVPRVRLGVNFCKNDVGV